MSRPEAIRNEFLTATPAPTPHLAAGPLRSRERADAARVAFWLLAAGLDLGCLMVLALGLGALFPSAAAAAGGFTDVAALMALFYVGAAVVQGDYQLCRFLAADGHGRRILRRWTGVLLVTLLVGFFTAQLDVLPRAPLALFYVLGFPALLGLRFAFVRFVTRGVKTGTVPDRRVFLIGAAAAIEDFQRTYQPWNVGFTVVGTAPLAAGGDGPAFSAGLDSAVAAARRLAPDDVFILARWSERAFIERCAEPFLNLPVCIHLGPERILDRFEDLRISRFGTLSTLSLARRPLTAGEVLLKRLFDLAGASVLLVLLLPVLLLVALLIRLDSRGPALFRQQRFGFNQQPFRIFKFRTMTVIEDGQSFTQAKIGDPRITRIGRVLRRYNIDELPQLINVLRGEMSLVGPRPHALAHDRDFERKIAFYARRHNVKPGITGWAQVNGFRGDTSTKEKMLKRVEHDLHYIDNWSLLLDVKIMVMTVISPKAYRNAY